MKGIFTISLDFELHWGGFEKWKLGKVRGTIPITIGNEVRSEEEVRGTRDEVRSEEKGRGTRNEVRSGDEVRSTRNEVRSDKREEYQLKNAGGIDYQQYFMNTREIIPEMLRLFQQHEVHVTWATVGMLFHRTKDELMKNAPVLKPTYAEQQLSAYHYIETKGIGKNEDEDPFHFAPSLIEKIVATPHQELGSHTFAHYYCNEAGQTAEQFCDDLRAAQRVASFYGKKLTSLVFPRNQFNDQYLKVCFEEGITSVRSNPLDWFWHIESTQAESMWKRLNRGLDAYFPIGKKNTYKISSLKTRNGFPVCIPASRLLRPYNPKEFFLNDFKINRICNEMSRAAQQGEVYHLWWHPHNFGRFPEESLQELKKILQHYSLCRDQWAMQSLGMGEITDLLTRTDHP